MPDIRRNGGQKRAIEVMAKKSQDEREGLRNKVQRGFLVDLRSQAAQEHQEQLLKEFKGEILLQTRVCGRHLPKTDQPLALQALTFT